jgi:hypothetical protein
VRRICSDAYQWGDGSPLLATVLLGAIAALVGCGDCTDEIEAARAFLEEPANLTCQSDDDCVVVSTGCHTFSRGTCGQAQVAGRAAESEEWSGLSAELSDCESASCAQCLALLTPRCLEGMCGGPE